MSDPHDECFGGGLFIEGVMQVTVDGDVKITTEEGIDITIGGDRDTLRIEVGNSNHIIDELIFAIPKRYVIDEDYRDDDA